MAQVRINKYISDTGFCSRREADKMILDARVEVNGVTAVPGTKVSEGDSVRIDGETLRANPASFAERPKQPRPKKRPVRFVPVEEEEPSARRSHRGTRGGVRTKVGRETPETSARPVGRQPKNKKENNHRPPRR